MPAAWKRAVKSRFGETLYGPKSGHGGRADVDVHRGQEVGVAERVAGVAHEEEIEQAVIVVVADRNGGGTGVVIELVVRGRSCRHGRGEWRPN